LALIDRVTYDEKARTIYLGTKDLRQFPINFKHSEYFNDVWKFILEIINSIPKGAFAFKFAQIFPEDGWSAVSYENDFSRMGLPNDFYRKTDVNSAYEVIPTYPNLLYIPKMISDDSFLGALDFRTKSRALALCWKHPKTQQVILRCSQPRTGVVGARNPADELYIKTVGVIIRTMLDVPDSVKTVLICDARPKANAVGNLAKGGGWESVDNYPDAVFHFANIPNIHVVRDSFQNLRDMYTALLDKSTLKDSMDSALWIKRYQPIAERLRKVEGRATWFYLLSRILAGAQMIAHFISRDQGSVVVHCSDGWDRTSQLTSLAQLLLDPYYRTLRGFCTLIQKGRNLTSTCLISIEWVAFGHKFAQRYGNGSNRDYRDEERSPIFIQWLDCVFQVMLAWPNEFEFKINLLNVIVHEVNSFRFGTFYGNCEK
jgi:myotubularin-related protein 1/2